MTKRALLQRDLYFNQIANTRSYFQQQVLNKSAQRMESCIRVNTDQKELTTMVSSYHLKFVPANNSIYLANFYIKLNLNKKPCSKVSNIDIFFIFLLIFIGYQFVNCYTFFFHFISMNYIYFHTRGYTHTHTQAQIPCLKQGIIFRIQKLKITMIHNIIEKIHFHLDHISSLDSLWYSFCSIVFYKV